MLPSQGRQLAASKGDRATKLMLVHEVCEVPLAQLEEHAGVGLKDGRVQVPYSSLKLMHSTATRCVNSLSQTAWQKQPPGSIV